MTANTTFTVGATYTAAQANNFGRGLMATPVTSITSDTTITGEKLELTYVFAAVNGRNYQVIYSEPSLNATVTSTVTGRLRQDSLTGTSINAVQITATSGFNEQLYCSAIFTATASGSKTIVATLQASAGTATAIRLSTRYAEMYVIDVGTGY